MYDSTTRKRCSYCGSTKPISEFATCGQRLRKACSRCFDRFQKRYAARKAAIEALVVDTERRLNKDGEKICTRCLKFKPLDHFMNGGEALTCEACSVSRRENRIMREQRAQKCLDSTKGTTSSNKAEVNRRFLERPPSKFADACSSGSSMVCLFCKLRTNINLERSHDCAAVIKQFDNFSRTSVKMACTRVNEFFGKGWPVVVNDASSATHMPTQVLSATRRNLSIRDLTT